MNLRFWRMPENLVLLPIFLLPLAAYSPVLLTSLAIITNFIALFWGYGKYQRNPWPAGDLMLWLVGFLSWALITCLWTLSPMKGLQSFILIGATLFGGLGAVKLLQRANWSPQLHTKIHHIFLYGVTFSLLMLAAEIFAGQPIYRLFRLVNGTDFSEFLNLSAYNRTITIFDLLAWPAAYIAWQYNKKWLGALIILIAVAVSVCGQSMSALLGLLLGIGVFCVALWRPRLSYQLCRIMVIVCFIGIFTAVNLINHIPYLKKQPNSISQRVEIWNFAARRAQRVDHFIQGYGLEASRQMPNFGEHSKFLDEGENIIPIHPHNFILHIWLELGAVGAALGAGILLTLLKHLQSLPRHLQQVAFPCFATAFGIALTAYGLWQAWWLAAIMIAALAITIARSVQKTDIVI